MRVFGITLSCLLLSLPLYAQQSGGAGNASSVGISSSASTGMNAESAIGVDQGVDNVSEIGGFIGSGAPASFVGIDEVYQSTSNSSQNSTASSRRMVTSTRSTARTATRRTASQAGAGRALSRGNSQYVRATATVDFDVPRQPAWEQRAGATETLSSNLQRIRGIQEGQITFKTSPLGRTAVLTGTVATERERRVAQQLILLEPGVNQVENLLEVR